MCTDQISSTETSTTDETTAPKRVIDISETEDFLEAFLSGDKNVIFQI
jgi:hypothetical protein